MAYLASVAADITESLPATIGSPLLTDYPPPAGWDVTLGNLGFTLRPSAATPYQRGTEQVRKQQIDTSESPGEQSLSSWWTRSQTSWDMGAGVKWYEPAERNGEGVNRFAESQGVDVWTPGAATLLRRSVADAARTVDTFVTTIFPFNEEGWLEAWGNTVVYNGSDGSTFTQTTPYGGITQPASTGRYVYVGHERGVSFFYPGTGLTTPLTTELSWHVPRVWWVKSRLIIAINNALYEVGAGSTGVIGTTAGRELYRHPLHDWEWTDVTEVGGAILASGFDGSTSAIIRFTVELDDAQQPILSGGSQVAQMPVGERITAMQVYLGSSIVLGTSSGVRVGAVSAAGDVQYGPLTVETANPVVDIAFRDRFAYAAVTAGLPDGSSGAVRIDLSAPMGDAGRYAYAWDMACGTSDEATSVSLVGDRVVLAAGRRLWRQHATEYVPQGWLETGRIRYGTAEPKAFRLMRAVVETNGGGVGITTIAPDGSEHRVVEFTDAFRTEDEVAVRVPGRDVNQFLSFRAYLSSPPHRTTTPVVSALSVKAVPAASRVRLYQFPLSCYDVETDRHGNTYGARGRAYAALAALEELEEQSRPVPVVDNRTGEAFVGQIDTVDFQSNNPPSRENDNFGGIAVVTVRRL